MQRLVGRRGTTSVWSRALSSKERLQEFSLKAVGNLIHVKPGLCAKKILNDKKCTKSCCPSQLWP